MAESYDPEQELHDWLMRVQPKHVINVLAWSGSIWVVACNYKSCPNKSEYMLVCEDPGRGNIFGDKRTVCLCSDHVPDRVKGTRVFRLAAFAARAKKRAD